MAGISLSEAILPSLLFLQLFGASPITLRPRKNQGFYDWFFPGVLYIFLLILIICTAFFSSINEISLLFEPGDDRVLTIHSTIVFFFGPVSSIIMLVSSLWTTKDASAVMDSLNSLCTIFPARFNLKWIRILSLTMIFGLLVNSALAVYNEIDVVDQMTHYSLEIFETIAMNIIWNIFDLVSWGGLVHMLLITGILYLLFRSLHNETVHILNELTLPSNFKGCIRVSAKSDLSKGGVFTMLRKVRLIHLELSCLAEEVNGIYATRILLWVALDTILLCFCTFMLLLSLTSKESPPTLRSLRYITIRFLPIVLTIFPFASIQCKVEKTRRMVYQWMSQMEKGDIADELSLFAKQLKDRKLTFSAHSFFNLEPSTLTSVVGAAVTYLVTLIQFHFLYETTSSRTLLGFSNSFSSDNSSTEIRNNSFPLCPCSSPTSYEELIPTVDYGQ